MNLHAAAIWAKSNAVALLALFVALGGTGYAAVSINGKAIKNGTISAVKLKKDTLGGREVKESKLGKVRSAAHADLASSADSARRALSADRAASATHADVAALATNASSLGGSDASAFARGPSSTILRQDEVAPSTSDVPVASLDPIGSITFTCGAGANSGIFTYHGVSRVGGIEVLHTSGGSAATHQFVAFSANDSVDAGVDPLAGAVAEFDVVALDLSVAPPAPPLPPGGQRVQWHVRASMSRVGSGCLYTAVATKLTA
ncbi:MAG: hypothetical protein ACJ76X_08110 [Solirubrobacteraceae bacterium]